MPFKTLDNAVLALRRGDVDAVIDDRNMAAYTLDTVPGMSHLEILPGTVGKIDCGVAMRKRDGDLRELVNEVITETKAEGQIAQWVSEHVGDRVAKVEGRHACVWRGIAWQTTHGGLPFGFPRLPISTLISID